MISWSSGIYSRNTKLAQHIKINLWPTGDQSGCLAGPRGCKVGAAIEEEAQGQPGVYPWRTGAPWNHLVETHGCLGADPLQQPQICGCTRREGTGCGVNGGPPNSWLGQPLCSQIGSGLCRRGWVGIDEQSWGLGGSEGQVVSKGGPYPGWGGLPRSCRSESRNE